jgi:hypothetical protein
MKYKHDEKQVVSMISADVKDFDRHDTKRPLPPSPLPHHGHIPPHEHQRTVQLEYNEKVMRRLSEVYGEAASFIISTLESSPPEIKLTVAIFFEIPVNIDNYPAGTLQPRFQTPFLTDENIGVLVKSLDCNNLEAAISIYNSCPPEQAMLAIAAAATKIKQAEEYKNDLQEKE